MTAPTDELAHALRGAADDIVERAHPRAVDPTTIWKRGRRAAWAARAAAVGLAAAVLAWVATIGLVMRPGPETLPADGSGLTYPQFVTELFPGSYSAGSVPVFGTVHLPEGASMRTYVIERNGLLSLVPGPSPLATEGTLAPDGRHVLTPEGVVDLRDATLARPNAADPLIGGDNVIESDGRWSPDSQHVSIPTDWGPAVVDLRANLTTQPLGGKDDDLIAVAGWRDDQTLVGVRETAGEGAPVLEVVSRTLSEERWTAETRIEIPQQIRAGGPSFVHASPDGSQLLLRFPDQTDSGSENAVHIDARSGKPVPLAGDDGPATARWDGCAPAWQDNLPLRSSGGLHRPGAATTVVEFSGRLDLGCVALAGTELTGTPDPHSAGVTRERVWRAALPVAAGLTLITAVWVVVALRRSRRLERPGKRWLPMIYVQRF